jgi:hypothetical protein
MSLNYVSVSPPPPSALVREFSLWEFPKCVTAVFRREGRLRREYGLHFPGECSSTLPGVQPIPAEDALPTGKPRLRMFISEFASCGLVYQLCMQNSRE